MTDPTPMRLLERCHAALCERLAELHARRECVSDEHTSTEMDEGRALAITLQLVRDLERQMGGRPPETNRWLGKLIEGPRRAA